MVEPGKGGVSYWRRADAENAVRRLNGVPLSVGATPISVSFTF